MRSRLWQFLADPSPPWWGRALLWVLVAIFVLIGTAVLSNERNYSRSTTLALYQTPRGIDIMGRAQSPPSDATSGVEVMVTVWLDESIGLRRVKTALRNHRALLPNASVPVGPEHFMIIDTLRRDNPGGIIRFMQLGRGPAPFHGENQAIRSFASGSRVLQPTSLGYVTIPVTALAYAAFPLSILTGLLRIRERRRCQYAINRWLAGLCPVCKYPRSDDAICPECGRDMAEQAGLACDRMATSLYDISPRSSAPALPPLDYTRD